MPLRNCLKPRKPAQLVSLLKDRLYRQKTVPKRLSVLLIEIERYIYIIQSGVQLVQLLLQYAAFRQRTSTNQRRENSSTYLAPASTSSGLSATSSAPTRLKPDRQNSLLELSLLVGSTIKLWDLCQGAVAAPPIRPCWAASRWNVRPHQDKKQAQKNTIITLIKSCNLSRS